MFNSDSIYKVCVDFINSIPRVVEGPPCSPYEQVIERQTLGLYLPRGVGKTTALKRLAGKLNNYCIIVPSHYVKETCWQDFSPCYNVHEVQNDSLWMGFDQSRPFSYILIDEAKLPWVSTEFRRMIGAETIVIMVGTLIP